MRFTYIFLSMILMACSLQAQDSSQDVVKIGDELIIGQPSESSYVHVAVPRKNFIIKRGGLPNISSVENSQVIVTDIAYGKKTQITFKRTNGKKFFRVYKTLTADLEGAIKAGELILAEKGETDL